MYWCENHEVTTHLVSCGKGTNEFLKHARGYWLSQRGLMTPYGDVELGQHYLLPDALVMTGFLMTPSHYLNHCGLIISEVFWHSPEGNFTGNAQDVYPWYEFENYSLKITVGIVIHTSNVVLFQVRNILDYLKRWVMKIDTSYLHDNGLIWKQLCLISLTT